MKNLLEIACFNIESCLIAQKAGADRIEFCSDHGSGGITPERENILFVKKQLRIPLHVIIRPRKGNFIYSASELEEMLADIQFCKENKVDGVVFGALTNSEEVDETALCRLKKAAGEMKCTFHRAIDECKDINASIELLVKEKIHSVLSSGGKSSALEGKLKLTELSKLYGEQIQIIAGGGIRSSQFPELFETNCHAFHSSAITDKSENCNENEVRQLIKLLKTNRS